MRTARFSYTRRMAVAAVSVFATLAILAPAAGAQQFGVTAFDGQVTSNAAGDPYTQAGGHPFAAWTRVDFNTQPNPDFFGLPEPVVDAKSVHVELPPGLTGNPEVVPVCDAARFNDLNDKIGHGGSCPLSSQVGVVFIESALGEDMTPLYRVEAPVGAPASFGFAYLGVRVLLNADLRSGDDYGLNVNVENISQGIQVIGTTAVFWGVPADPAHDNQRCRQPIGSECTGTPGDERFGPNPAGVAERPLITLPTACTAPGVGLETRLRTDSWEAPGHYERASFVSHLPPALPAPPESWGPPQGPTGCDELPFEPQISVRPTTLDPDAPTGLAVELTLPQDGLETPTALATAHMRRATVTLPDGMAINPAAADGLGACSDAELGIGSAAPPTCPGASKIGTVSAETPLLDEPLDGAVYVRSQASADPASGEMFRLALVLENEQDGLLVKLAGQVRADPRTGRLTTTFDENPQLPFSRLVLRLKGGPRAPLATPAECGVKAVESELTSWAGHAVDLVDTFAIPCSGGETFAPSFDAGVRSPIAASFSPFAARIERGDRDRFLAGVEVDLPKGLLARLAGVELCPEAVAGDGTPGVCPAGSRVGTATVGAGSGSPFYLSGPVYLTGPYKGAPYGLSVQVPAKAGPFDLGVVKVRQRIEVDPESAEVSVVSDSLPQVVSGVPVRLRDVRVETDRPSFTVNPTSCSEKQVTATLTSVAGQVHRAGQRFQVADCQSLRFGPRMAMRLSGRKQTRTGGHPGLTATVSQTAGQANIAGAKVTLPRSVVLDPLNTADPKMLCGYDESLKADCPASSVIGKATAATPVLNRPLTGDVHLVQGINFGPKGNRIRTTPSLLVKLRGEVAINLRARTTTEKGTNRLVTTFGSVPDAPVSKFTMKIAGGKKGILVVTRTARRKLNLCSSSQVANVETDAHNGKRANFATGIKTPCGKAAKKAKRAKANRSGGNRR